MDIMRKLKTNGNRNILYENFTAHPAQVIEELKKMLDCTLDYEKENGKLKCCLIRNRNV